MGKKIIIKSSQSRITRASVKKLDEVFVSQKLCARITRSKSVLKPVKIIDKSANLNKLSSRASEKKSAVTDLVKLSPRITRSKVEKSPINVDLVAPTAAIQTPALKVVKRAEFVKKNISNVNDFVLAKQKYSLPWPARVLAIEKDKVQVFFFGDKRTGFVKSSELYDFTKSFFALRSIVLSKKKPAGYITGLTEVELLLGRNGANSILNAF